MRNATAAPEFATRFQAARRHLRHRAVWTTASRLLPWLLLAAAAAWIAARRFVPEHGDLLAWSWLALAAIFFLAIAIRAIRIPSGRDAALFLDHHLGSRELLTTACEALDVAHPFAQLARQRAADTLEPSGVTRALPLPGWNRWRPALLAVGALSAAAFVPVPAHHSQAPEALAAEPVVKATGEALAVELETLKDGYTELDHPESVDALERIAAMVDSMRAGETATAEDALVAIDQLERTFAGLDEPGRPTGFAALVEDLAADPLSSELAETMSSSDHEALRDVLERLADALDPADLSAANAERKRQEIASLAERFTELAKLLEEAGHGDLAAKMRQIAEALEAGDLERARELMASDDTAAACRFAGQAAGSERLKSEAQELLQLARYLLGSDPARLAERDDNGDGNSQAEGAGPHPGTGSTNREGAGYTTGEPIVRNRQSASSSDRQAAFEALYGERLEGTSPTVEVRLLGQVGQDGEMLAEPGRGLGVDGGTSLPLRPFTTSGGGAPEAAVDLETVPLGYRDLVRDYFRRNESRRE